MNYTCRGCDGTCCTGVGSDPCTCPPPSTSAIPPGPALGALLLATDGLTTPRGDDGGYLVRRPAHEDTHPSLSLRQFSDGLIIHCHAGCAVEEVLEVLSMSTLQLISENRKAAL